MKRQALHSPKKPSKRPRVDIPDYHLTPSKQDPAGNVIWPAPASQIKRAREIIQECVKSNAKVLLVPDKDADGLTSGAILRTTLIHLGLPIENISAHFISKGNSIASESERQTMTSLAPAYVFVLDQGSIKCPPLVDSPHKSLIIDHHHYEDGDFPEGAEFVSACKCPPVATSSLLTYHICASLHPKVEEDTRWLCAIGTHGDLGNTFKWEPPFPDMKEMFKAHSKQRINSAVSMLNAPRRTAAYDVQSAWTALISAENPSGLLNNRRLLEARAEVNAEVERCTHTPPRFSADGSVAFFRISSGAQVHPVIATRWAGHLRSTKLHIVMVANDGYIPDKVNFSCRIARCARERGEDVNIIKILEEVAAKSASSDFRDRLGSSFARGHKEASGGIVDTEVFEEFVQCLELVDRTKVSKEKEKAKPAQTNTMMNYFRKVG